ncbi:hypothetical protein FDI21_gp163 [Pseudomonas phage Noxifer]|uniref:Uncharacterized protein n=1 Tax=Pseudomonas phage Noxifer TaxID=2006684 RepID=A0A1Y0SUZ1_9CAUD|nr:hypothetical protein FDI21_gp163 [Pseudomonas phage Noxifer]ARV77332.1 hypothetical protein NOXIFER_163 [Pseudomonas phage Noxifer]
MKALKYHQYLLLDETSAVELNDSIDQLWQKESKEVSTTTTKSGLRTQSHWRKRSIEDMTEEALRVYSELLAAEVSDPAPVVEYEFRHEDVLHRLTKYSAHMVYHVTAPKLQLERVVVAKDAETMVNHSYGIGALYYRLVTDLS